MILICYDRSADSHAAVVQASKLFAGQAATVLSVWEPFEELVAHKSLGFGAVVAPADVETIDKGGREQAETAAAEGAKLATELGMSAVPKIVVQRITIARTILAEAETLDALAIVMGSRGLTGVKSLLLGSVSHEVIQHADRAVVVVPSGEVAASRARAMHEKGANVRSET